MKPDLPIGTVIENRAWIRFNYGDSIETNKVQNQIVDPDALEETTTSDGQLAIYSNPSSKDNFTLVFEQTTSGDFDLEISEISGKRIYQRTFQHKDLTTLRPDISLSAGIYLIAVESEAGRWVEKLVVK